VRTERKRVMGLETLSRTEKYRRRKQEAKGGRIAFRIALIVVYILLFYVLVYFVKVPVNYAMRVGLEVGLLFISVILLDAYLQAFTTISAKQVQKAEGQAIRANPFIISLWVLSLCYHLSIGLLSSIWLPDWVYYGGFLFTIGLLFATLVHFLAYFAYNKKERKWLEEEMYASDQRRAYEMIRDNQSQYYWIRDVMERNDEVRQMMKWNRFDYNLEEHLYDLQPYFQRTIFTNKDLEKIAAIQAWLDNMRRIIEEHPNYQNVKKQTGDNLSLRRRR
jgi:hypothetical protein